jgi:hypothetical protein
VQDLPRNPGGAAAGKQTVGISWFSNHENSISLEGGRVMVKLSGSISRKVPIVGIEFSSQSYSAGMEVEVSDGESPEVIRERIRTLYGLLSSAIDEQIANAGHRPIGAAPNGNVSVPAPVPQGVNRLPAAQPNHPPNGGNDNGNGNGGGNGKRLAGKATQAQQRAVYAISKSLGLDLAAVLADYSVASAADLTVKDASRLIDDLKSRQSNAPARG